MSLVADENAGIIKNEVEKEYVEVNKSRNNSKDSRSDQPVHLKISLRKSV